MASGLNNYIMNQTELREKNQRDKRQSLRSEKDTDYMGTVEQYLIY